MILQDKRLLPHYSLEVTKHDRMENLTVMAEVRPDAGGFGETFRDEIAKDLARRIKSSVGFSVQTKFFPVDEIERSRGRSSTLSISGQMTDAYFALFYG